MSEVRDLDFYLANPDQMPGDLAEIEKLMGGSTGEDTEQTGELSAASGAEGGKAASEAGGANDGKPAAEEPPAEPQVIKSKNGKHEIPYQVLEHEREARKQAESAVEQMKQRLEALERQAQGGQQAEPAAATKEPELSSEELAQISEDFPAVGKLLGAMAKQVEALSSQLTEVRQSEGSRRQVEAKSAATTVQEAIDNNAHLSYWQQQDPDMWDAAIKFDNQIKADPRNQGLTLEQRFEKVTKAVQAVYGEAELPEQYRREAKPAATPAPTPAAKNTAPKLSAEQVAAAAQQVIDKAQGQSAVRSLSDIPGGVPPESDEITQLGMLSAHELGNKFMTMDPNKILQILARAA